MGEVIEPSVNKKVSMLWPVLAVLTIAAAISGAAYLPTPVVDYFLKQDILDRSELWQRRITLHLRDTEATFRNGTTSPEENDFLSLLPEASDVYRFKLFTADGRVFWSTRSSDLGTINEKDYFTSIVSNGEIYYKHEPKPASEIDGLLLHSHNTAPDALHEIAEVYVPMMQNGEFIGAIEFYTDITKVRTLFIQRVHTALIALSALAIIVVLLIGGLIVRSNRARLNALNSKSKSERALMDQQLHLAQEVKLLGELNEWLQSSRSLDELFEMFTKFMAYMLPDCAGSIYVYSNSRDVLDGVSAWNGGELKRHIHPDGCWGLRRGRTYTYGVHEVDFVCEHVDEEDGEPYFCFPILAHGETVGLMHLKKVAHADKEEFLESRKLAQMCAEQISMAIANVRMRDQLQEQSIRDPLTGLFNRRHMIDRLRHFLITSSDKQQNTHLVYLDLDHFKRFNDTHGHDAGDYVLRAVGETLDESCTDDEIACRMGGEEFVVLWPRLTKEELQGRITVLCSKISGLALTYQSQPLPKITASIGVATAPQHGELPQELLRAADEAMYQAKHNGRDQVIYYRTDQNPPLAEQSQPIVTSSTSDHEERNLKSASKRGTTEIAAE